MNTKTPHSELAIIDLINTLSISSQRLTLKKFSMPDAKFNIDHELDPQLMQYIRDPLSKEKTSEKTEEKIKDWSGEEQEWVLFALRLKQSDAYVGLVCFRYESIENDTVEIGWRLGHEFHGLGLATEAAQALLGFIKTEIKPHKVMAYCVAENTASSNIMTKLGMQQEGCLRQFSKLGGQWFDEDIYAVILD